MADNVGYTPGSGETIATDDVGGRHFQLVKPHWGANNTANETSEASPLPVQVLGEAIEAIEAMRMAIQALTRTIGLMQPDTAARMRVALDSVSANLTLGTVSTVTTVSTLTNQTQIGSFAATEQIPSLMRLGADSLRRNILVT
jgi:hypothetical protein